MQLLKRLFRRRSFGLRSWRWRRGDGGGSRLGRHSESPSAQVDVKSGRSRGAREQQ